MDAITPPPLRQDWTEERIAVLKDRRIVQGFSCGMIAKELGISRSAVIGKLSRLGLCETHDGKPYKVKQPKVSLRARTSSGHLRRKNRNRVMEESFGGINRATLAARKLRAQALAHAQEIALPGTALTDLPPDRSPHAVSLLDARETQCRWPRNDPRTAEFLFCGAPIKDGQRLEECPYCPRHDRLAHSERVGGWTRPDVSARLRRERQIASVALGVPDGDDREQTLGGL